MHILTKNVIYIITSIEPDELHVEDTKNNGPKLFKKYLEYSKLYVIQKV